MSYSSVDRIGSSSTSAIDSSYEVERNQEIRSNPVSASGAASARNSLTESVGMLLLKCLRLEQETQSKQKLMEAESHVASNRQRAEAFEKSKAAVSKTQLGTILSGVTTAGLSILPTGGNLIGKNHFSSLKHGIKDTFSSKEKTLAKHVDHADLFREAHLRNMPNKSLQDAESMIQAAPLRTDNPAHQDYIEFNKTFQKFFSKENAKLEAIYPRSNITHANLRGDDLVNAQKEYLGRCLDLFEKHSGFKKLPEKQKEIYTSLRQELKAGEQLSQRQQQHLTGFLEKGWMEADKMERRTRPSGISQGLQALGMPVGQLAGAGVTAEAEKLRMESERHKELERDLDRSSQDTRSASKQQQSEYRQAIQGLMSMMLQTIAAGKI